MCGIAGLVLKEASPINVLEVTSIMSVAVRHRGPDGHGAIAITPSSVLPLSTIYTRTISRNLAPYIPKQSSVAHPDEVFASFAHRRLSILDLSSLGHQPMCSLNETVWITYNGELYNYIELRQQLIDLGRVFISETDTEVIINAYQEWGEECVTRFNGMWAFCIYDSIKKQFFASRDRLGVKPFYYINSKEYFAFASEQKAFIKSGLLERRTSQKAVYSYLIADTTDLSGNSFFDGITELKPGHNCVYRLSDKQFVVKEFFNKRQLLSFENNHLSDKQIIEKIRERVYEATRIRLRSHVPIGACLSGGVDSSTLVGVIKGLGFKSLNTFTATFPGFEKDEGGYAKQVSDFYEVNNYAVNPTIEGFSKTIDSLIYALDSPIFDTSTYAQFLVMERIKNSPIKVVIDGQGADELFGGYHHHFFSMWKEYFSENQYLKGFSSLLQSSKSIDNPTWFFMKEKLKENRPAFLKKSSGLILPEFEKAFQEGRVRYRSHLNNQLLEDMGDKRLKFYLRCEDRCSMWHGVESRTPFSDDLPLMKLMFSFDGKRKIQKGVSKYLLREAFKAELPATIYKRYDKIGFDSPSEKWVNKLKPTMIETVLEAKMDFVNREKLIQSNDYKMLFKLYVLAKWGKL